MCEGHIHMWRGHSHVDGTSQQSETLHSLILIAICLLGEKTLTIVSKYQICPEAS